MAPNERKQPSRLYRVLSQVSPDTFADLGSWPGRDAKTAVEAALLARNLPSGAEGCVAVPTNNWSEYNVEPDPRPHFKVTMRMKAVAQDQGEMTGAQEPGL